VRLAAEARQRAVLTGSALTPGMSAAEIDQAVSAQVATGSASTHSTRHGSRDRSDLVVTQQLCRSARSARSRWTAPCARFPLPGGAVARSEDPDRRLCGHPEGRRGDRTAAGGRRSPPGSGERLAAVRARVAGRPRPRVLALEWLDPPLRRPLDSRDDRSGRRRRCHRERRRLLPAAHLGADRGGRSRCHHRDAVRLRRGGAHAQMALAANSANSSAWQRLRAVRTGRVHPVDANGCFSRPGPAWWTASSGSPRSSTARKSTARTGFQIISTAPIAARRSPARRSLRGFRSHPIRPPCRAEKRRGRRRAARRR